MALSGLGDALSFVLNAGDVVADPDHAFGFILPRIPESEANRRVVIDVKALLSTLRKFDAADREMMEWAAQFEETDHKHMLPQGLDQRLQKMREAAEIPTEIGNPTSMQGEAS